MEYRSMEISSEREKLGKNLREMGEGRITGFWVHLVPGPSEHIINVAFLSSTSLLIERAGSSYLRGKWQ